MIGLMIDTEHLEGLVRLIDSRAEERGWNEGHFLVNIVAADLDGADVGFKDIEGHPLNSLLGFTAPTEWLALGVCAEGWAASIRYIHCRGVSGMGSVSSPVTGCGSRSSGGMAMPTPGTGW